VSVPKINKFVEFDSLNKSSNVSSTHESNMESKVLHLISAKERSASNLNI